MTDNKEWKEEEITINDVESADAVLLLRFFDEKEPGKIRTQFSSYEKKNNHAPISFVYLALAYDAIVTQIKEDVQKMIEDGSPKAENEFMLFMHVMRQSGQKFIELMLKAASKGWSISIEDPKSSIIH